MKSTTVVAVALTAVCLFSLPVHAVIGAIDPVPAATVLLPYFEVDASNPSGLTTLFTITNTGPATAIAHAVLWTDWGVPTFAFDMQLTGYDVQAVNIRDIFNGFTPGAGGVQNIPDDELERIVAAHSGQPSPVNGLCNGRNYGDSFFRGYVTVDSVTALAGGFPSDVGYFVPGGLGTADNRNVLWGEYMRVDPLNNFASGETMIHIEADALDGRINGPGDYTFYGGLIGALGSDNREPLASEWGMPFRNDGDGGTSIIYWRDIRQVGIGRPCGAFPNWYPLSVMQLTVARNLVEIENPFVQEAFPLACGRTEIGFDLPTNFQDGFIFLGLDHNAGTMFMTGAQSVVAVMQDSQGRFSTESTATALQSSIQP